MPEPTSLDPLEPSHTAGAGVEWDEGVSPYVDDHQRATSSREVTCPECGRVSRITVNRRESHDFCPGCDFPLFWTPSQLLRSEIADSAREALRRLPGTGGRVSVGSLVCPHCAEANPVAASTCLRCGGTLHPEPMAAPAPFVPPPPPPAPEPEPEPFQVPLWAWVLGAMTLVVLVALIVVGLR